MKVLFLSDHCNPTWASTPFFGYQLIRAIAPQVTHSVLATQVRNRGAFTAQDIGVDEVVWLDNDYVAKPLWRLSNLLRRGKNKAMTLNVALQFPSYLAFEREAWKHFGKRIRAGEFDVVHRVTPLSPTMASPMAKRSPIPFVLGPINGGLRWPKAFSAELSREREWMTHLRDLHKALPYYRSTYAKSAAILAGFPHTIERLPASARPRVFDCPDVGCEEIPGFDPDARPLNDTMTVLFVGRLVPYKCPDVVVRAFAASPLLRKHRLVIVGDGPDRPLIEKLIADNDLGSCVTIAGWLSHDAVIDQMAKADVFAFPSIRELGAGVVIEAMGMGLPCVVADYGGPGAYAAGGRALAVPVTSKDDLVQGFANALERLAENPQERRALGNAARDYVLSRHTWAVKAAKIVQVYEWALGRRAEKPDFYEPLVGTTA